MNPLITGLAAAVAAMVAFSPVSQAQPLSFGVGTRSIIIVGPHHLDHSTGGRVGADGKNLDLEAGSGTSFKFGNMNLDHQTIGKLSIPSTWVR